MTSFKKNLADTALTPTALFWLFAGIYFACWTVVPTFAIANVPIDTLEGYAWGHEWQLGSYKHPPLAAWILEALAILTRRASWAHFFANEVSVFVAFWAVWRTGKRIVGENKALVAVGLLAVVPYYNILIPEFNPNVLQLPFWALIGWSFHRAVKENKTIDWLALGLWSAAGMYSKYSTALLLAALIALMLGHPEARKHLKSKGPWLTILFGMALMMPHIVWLFENRFMPFTYAENRFQHPPYPFDFIIVPAQFVFWQALTLLPAIVLYAGSFGKPRAAAQGRDIPFDKAFLYTVAFGPALITALIAMGTRDVIRNMWATPDWNFIGLWAVYAFTPALSPHRLRRFAGLWIFFFVVGLAGFVYVEALAPYVTHKVKRINFSGKLFAAQISKNWHERYHTPLRYVVGDTWIGGNIAYYAPDRPHLLIFGNYEISPWIKPADIGKDGGVIVWCGLNCDVRDHDAVPPYLRTEFPQAQIQKALIFPQGTHAQVPLGMVDWAIIPPRDAANGQQKP
ncbi:MAG: glycosyltransferase family 39 protein [Alphaproteobacteria bacterium]|nr:glycosyltransferase family 39 protein [Alphaproteobacteria bacterium]MDE2336001.1 glycosyltransferase family 39 protein [Alphaproteobacteria bacterium]